MLYIAFQKQLRLSVFLLAVAQKLICFMALYNPGTPSFPTCHLFLTSFLSFQWHTSASEGYLCLQGSVRYVSVCVRDREKACVCVCHSICSHINSHFPPEQTHFPNTHLTHESQQAHTHTHTHTHN